MRSSSKGKGHPALPKPLISLLLIRQPTEGRENKDREGEENGQTPKEDHFLKKADTLFLKISVKMKDRKKLCSVLKPFKRIPHWPGRDPSPSDFKELMAKSLLIKVVISVVGDTIFFTFDISERVSERERTRAHAQFRVPQK